MLKVNTCGAIRTDDDLKLRLLSQERTLEGSSYIHLVVPSVDTRPNLFTVLQRIRPTQIITARIRKVHRSRIVETDHEQRVVDDLKAGRVMAVGRELRAKFRPVLSVLCRKDTDCPAGNL